MKTLLLLLGFTLVSCIILTAQAPHAFKYQAIARDEAGNILSNRLISFKISVIEPESDGTNDYIETQQVTSNSYGLIDLIIGKGEVVSGDFSELNWGKDSYYIKMEMDVNGGNEYKELGTAQLFAVPYALYAEQAGSVIGSSSSSSSSGSRSSGDRNGGANSKTPADDDSFLNVNAGNVGVGTNNPQTKLDVDGKIMSSEGYNMNGDDGLSDTLNMVTDLDFDNSKLQYRTQVSGGGIVTTLSDKSGWVDTVDVRLYFACGDSLLDDRDGKKYATVKIGDQCWFAQSINIGSKINGGVLPSNDGGIEKYCYDNSEAFCDIYGGLYNWDEAMFWVEDEGAQGICPIGWHIPTDDEWKILEGNVDSEYGVGDPEWNGDDWRGSDAGKNIKSTSGWDDGGNGLDLFGFNALPAGQRGVDGVIDHSGESCNFWTSTITGNYSWDRSLYKTMHTSRRLYRNHKLGYSIRCLKN